MNEFNGLKSQSKQVIEILELEAKDAAANVIEWAHTHHQQMSHV